MPCYDSRDSAESVRAELKNKIARLEALVCMLSRHIAAGDEKQVTQVAEMIGDAQYLAAGLSRADFAQWLLEHEAKDQQRKIAELIDSAKTKLTSAELDALLTQRKK